MNFTGKYKSALQKTGKLPADNYHTLCTRPVRPADYAPLGEEQCKPFYLASLQLPILMKPYNEELLDPKESANGHSLPLEPRGPGANIAGYLPHTGI